jgi:hypothetical protein
MDSHGSLPTLKLVLTLAASLAGGCGGRAHYTPATIDGGTADANDAGPDAEDVVFVGTVGGVPNVYSSVSGSSTRQLNGSVGRSVAGRQPVTRLESMVAIAS